MACPRCHDERSCGTSAAAITYHAYSEVIGESEYVKWHRHAPRPLDSSLQRGNQAPLSI